VAERTAREPVEWSVATRSLGGDAASGDLAVVVPGPGGALVAGIDGVGHGSEAARAARMAGEVVRAAASRDLALLVDRCHAALRGTRGAAISLAFVSADGALTWLGVGNVEGRVLSGDPSASRPKCSLALARGIAGHELPVVRTAAVEVRPGDVLVFATDGVDPSFADALTPSGSTRAITERIMARHRKPTDDALVVAVRYLGVRR
jgi:negative regulator of sigma-B (phosphoserine phosphatase)